MSETETPLLHIAGTLTEKDFRSALRARRVRPVLFMTFLLFLIYAIPVYGIRLYNDYPYMKLGVWSFGEWVKLIWEYDGQSNAFIFIGFAAVYALLLLWHHPNRASKRFRELYPSGASIAIDFYEDCFSVLEEGESASASNRDTLRLQYSQMRRRIIENARVFVVSTGQRNRIVLHKAIMTPQEIEAVRELLHRKCAR